MPERKSKKKKPDDINILASSIVEQATGRKKKSPIDPDVVQKALDEGKDPLAVLLGQRGGLKGGKVRAAKLSAERRKEIAQKAAQARWKKPKSK
ncbi:MAG: hypothetical protein ABFR82_10830 [Nitrospirota bacterium]